MIKALKDLPFKGLVQKRIGELSSGMRQRIKLLLAIMTDTSVILLDEPGSNLDEQGKGWFEDLLKSQMSGKITIIASNEAEDLKLAQSQINIADYK
ncbi:MAG: ATP-binding cassette domain-containing protein [Saprospiraceae bacterium]|nr:ATP-binding cassette domain-containing protein [Candidatus Brachybacter algidus]